MFTPPFLQNNRKYLLMRIKQLFLSLKSSVLIVLVAPVVVSIIGLLFLKTHLLDQCLNKFDYLWLIFSTLSERKYNWLSSLPLQRQTETHPSYYFRFEQLPLKALQIHLEFADDDIVHLLLSLFDYILLTFVLASFYPIVQ